ncbi:hypothetical protein E8E15_000151 [Penicillium rubens]|nr:hypothetical protein E8E15_000151 [Penicillium rubens]
MPTTLSCVNGLSCSSQLLGPDWLLHPLAALAGSSRIGQDKVDRYVREGLSISHLALTGKTINANGLFSVDWRAIYSPLRLQELVENGFSTLQKISAILVGDLGMRKQLITRPEYNEESNEEWAGFEVQAKRPELISNDEWDSAEMGVDERSGDEENSQAETVILEIPPTGDLEQDVTDKDEGVSFLPRPDRRLINSLRGRFPGR